MKTMGAQLLNLISMLDIFFNIFCHAKNYCMGVLRVADFESKDKMSKFKIEGPTCRKHIIRI